MKDFMFVDALSGTPLGAKGKDSVRPVQRRSRRASLETILVALIALIIILAAWAFS